MQTSSLSLFPSLPADLLAALAQPFPAEQVELRVGTHEQRGQRWMCCAIPFVPKRFYEDRLNTLVPGRWSSTTPSLLIETTGRLVIAAQVEICGVAHTDYGERPLRPVAVQVEKDLIAPDATTAFEYAFVGACSSFGAGRYLADLERRWVPYDPRHRRMLLTSSDQHQLVLTLYRQAHIPLTFSRLEQLRPSYPGWPPYEPGRSPRDNAIRQNETAALLHARDAQ